MFGCLTKLPIGAKDVVTAIEVLPAYMPNAVRSSSGITSMTLTACTFTIS